VRSVNLQKYDAKPDMLFFVSAEHIHNSQLLINFMFIINFSIQVQSASHTLRIMYRNVILKTMAFVALLKES
jgi:hypothetical protein